MIKEKNLELDRLVFFSDAVVAIAITLLALDLKLPDRERPITFNDVWEVWPHFLAFTLSFIIIGMFWKIHHQLFMHIGNVNEKLMGLNMLWLFGIALLPFSTNAMSGHLLNKPAVVIYSANVFFISFFQNLLWDYACNKVILFPGLRFQNADGTLLKSGTDADTIVLFRTACNIHWINASIALALAFLWTPASMFILFTRLLFFRSTAVKWIEQRFRREKAMDRSRGKKTR